MLSTARLQRVGRRRGEKSPSGGRDPVETTGEVDSRRVRSHLEDNQGRCRPLTADKAREVLMTIEEME